MRVEKGLNPVFIRGFDLPDVWFKAVDKLLDVGYEYVVQRGSFVGHKRKEFDFVVLHVTNPGNRPLIPEVPKDLEGIVPAPTSIDYVYEYFLGYIATGEKKPEEAYTYGQRLTSYEGVNQLREAIEILKNTPETNQAIMEIGTPTDILLEDPPCLRLIDLRVRYGKLHFVVYFRSWDLWGGLPANLAAIQLLKEHMAKEIGVGDGELVCVSKGLHLYDYQFEWAMLITRRKKPEG